MEFVGWFIATFIFKTEQTESLEQFQRCRQCTVYRHNEGCVTSFKYILLLISVLIYSRDIRQRSDTRASNSADVAVLSCFKFREVFKVEKYKMNGNFHSRGVRESRLVSFSIYHKNLIGKDPMQDRPPSAEYITVPYSTVQYSTVQYSTVQYSTVQYSTDEPCWIMFQIYNEQRPVR